jgi:hypothetical protein
MSSLQTVSRTDGDQTASESIYLDYAGQLRQLGIADLA